MCVVNKCACVQLKKYVVISVVAFMGSGLMSVNVMALFYDYLKGDLVAVAFYN